MLLAIALPLTWQGEVRYRTNKTVRVSPIRTVVPLSLWIDSPSDQGSGSPRVPRRHLRAKCSLTVHLERTLRRRNGRNGHFSLAGCVCGDLVHACITGPDRRTWTISFVGRVGNSTVVHWPAHAVGLQRRRRRRERTWVALHFERSIPEPREARVAAAAACPGLGGGAGCCGLGGGEERCAPQKNSKVPLS